MARDSAEMTGGEPKRDAFVFGADVPTRGELLGAASLGGSGRELVEAMLAGNLDQVEGMLARDPALLKLMAGDRSLLEIAVAAADPALVDLLLAKRAPLDGDGTGGPLVLALHATTPVYAHALLSAGASPTPAGDLLAAFRAATALASEGGVRMLLDFDADPDTIGPLGRRPLHIALDMEKFRVAELLIARGADLWAADDSGGNLGSAAAKPMVTADAEEHAAQARLSAMASKAGWPDPAPTPQAVRAMMQEGHWPPARR